MAFQAAYYYLYGRNETTYEPAMTKAFLHGRTEAIRTVSPASADFVKIFTTKGESASKKLNALRKACEAHTKLSKACASGKGFDRHLYGLRCLVKELQEQGKWTEKTPELFTDAGYEKINHTVLSTSNCGNPALRLFGFGPVAPDGFGLGYIIKDDAISVCAASKHLQTKRFLNTLSNYLDEIREVLIENFKAANVRQADTYIDHQGRECDIRTGMPIGSHQHKNSHNNGYDLGDEEGPSPAGYSFYGEQQQQDNKRGKPRSDSDAEASRIEGVGRLLIHNEY